MRHRTTLLAIAAIALALLPLPFVSARGLDALIQSRGVPGLYIIPAFALAALLLGTCLVLPRLVSRR